MNDLNVLRQKIDDIDDQITELISRRFKITDEIGLLKACNDLPALDKSRENQILSRLAEKSELLSLNPDLIGSIFRLILSEVVLKHNSLLKHGRNTK